MEEANEYMKSEAFAKNPLGVEVAPKKLVEQLRAGADEKALLRRDENGEIVNPDTFAKKIGRKARMMI